MREKLTNLLTGILVVCALIVTGLVVRRELFPLGRPPSVEPREIKGWREVAGAGSLMGPADAKVRIVEFSDFQCPFCARVQSSLRAIREKYPREVVVVYRHFPLEAIHPHAFDAALAATCAEAQGRFEAYHDALFARQDSIGVVPWTRFAELASVTDTAAFERCVTERRFHEKVRADLQAGGDIGVQGTPSLIVNGTLLYGASTTEELEKWVVKAMEEVNATTR